MTPQIYTETVSRQEGVYLQDQIAIGRLRVTVGGRQDWARDRTTNPITGSTYINKSDAFTWRAGAVYLFDNGLAPYASYAESFLPQVADPSTTINGAGFVPTTGQQYEAGLRYQSGRNIYLSLGAYQITQQNIVTPATLADMPAGSTQAQYQAQACYPNCQVQTGEGRIRGIEFEGKASLPWGMAVIATTTKSWSKITETNTAAQLGNRLPQVPEWMASLFLDQRITAGPLDGLGLGGGVRYTGKSMGENANTLEIPDYALFDLFVRYDFGNGMVASVNARNIADKRYVATCTAVSACYYGQGRSVTARLDMRW
jgi:iron complex outermembrane receptor protein